MICKLIARTLCLQMTQHLSFKPHVQFTLMCGSLPRPGPKWALMTALSCLMLILFQINTTPCGMVWLPMISPIGGEVHGVLAVHGEPHLPPSTYPHLSAMSTVAAHIVTSKAPRRSQIAKRTWHPCKCWGIARASVWS
jgi:hypothetical protein